MTNQESAFEVSAGSSGVEQEPYKLQAGDSSPPPPTREQTGWAIYEIEDGGPRWEPDLPCGDCGGPHYVDCVLPSDIWNQIAKPHEILCPNCIDKRLDDVELVCVEAEMYFAGKRLSSRLYVREPRND